MPVALTDVGEQIIRDTVHVGADDLSLLRGGPPDGPAIVFLHGLASDAETWDRVLAPLAARDLHVVALDFVGHGRSDKPDRPYDLDEMADSVRDLLDTLDIDVATLCGHSLGGAIAMNVAHRHPKRVSGLVLVAAGGLGREVHLALRAASLPVAPYVLRAVTAPRLQRLYGRTEVHRALRLTPDNVANLRRASRALGSTEGRSSFFAALRGVIEPGGQRGSYMELGVLTDRVPTLLIWNEGDPVIPVAHARATHRQLPTSRLVVFPGGGHEPHRRSAQRFVDEVAAFVLRGDSIDPSVPTD